MYFPDKTRFRKFDPQQALVFFVYGCNLVIISWLWWRGSHMEAGSLHAVLTILGRLTGLISAYAALWQLLLIGRMPIIKRAFGMEQELHLHRWNGYVAIYFLLAHVALSTTGYAMTLHVNVLTQFIDFVVNYEDVLKATVATVLMIGLVVMSMIIVKQHFKYETWYLVHLTSYLAIVLGFWHQLSIGTDFIKQPGFTQYWWAMYGVVFGLIIAIRLIWPLAEALWQGFRVESVVGEADNIYSIYISGRHLNRFRFEAGQFAIWHFLSGPLAWQGHPFSISNHPGEPELRITFKAVGDYTQHLKHTKPGTRVIIEGPFGAFCWRRARTNKVLMIAGGIGLTPIISMLGEAESKHKSIHLLYAVRSQADIVFKNPLEALAAHSTINLTFIIESSAVGLSGRLDRQKLRFLVPDLKEREVFLCGPPAMMTVVRQYLVAEGVRQNRIYSEKFTF